MIYCVLILKDTGENIYCRSYENKKWNEAIFSGYISAFFSVSKAIFGGGVLDVELGTYRLSFESGYNAIYAAFYDLTDSVAEVRKKLQEIKDRVQWKYRSALRSSGVLHANFAGMEDIIDEVVAKSNMIDISDELKDRYAEILETYRKTGEIADCEMISITGTPIIEGVKKEFLNMSTRLMDVFWKLKNGDVNQITVYFDESYLILHKINTELVLVTKINSRTPIGLAHRIIEDMSSAIGKLGNRSDENDVIKRLEISNVINV